MWKTTSDWGKPGAKWKNLRKTTGKLTEKRLLLGNKAGKQVENRRVFPNMGKP